jgi:Arylsulfotransferase (ASST)
MRRLEAIAADTDERRPTYSAIDRAADLLRRAHRWLGRYGDVAVSGIGLAAFVFLVGIAVGRIGLFPWPFINAALDAANDLRENAPHYLGLRSRYEGPTDRPGNGVTMHDPSLAFQGYTFFTGYRRERPDRYDACLLDMDGNIVHSWDTDFRRVWPRPTHVDMRHWDGNVEIHGSFLYPNGDILVNLGGAGAAKLDRCSNVLWTVDRPTHHHVEPLPDGGAVFPSKIRRTEAQADRPFVEVGPFGFYDDDTVLVVGPDGSVLHEESVIDILFRSGWESVLFSQPRSGRRIQEEDPIHLNDIEILKPEFAAAFPMFAAGDLMLSLRETNTLMVVDPRTWKAKWVMTGPFLGQHDPDFLPNGHILVYDNRITGRTPRFGNTRLLEIDPSSKTVVQTFDFDTEQQFYGESRGQQRVLPNGNLLIADVHHGRLFEIAPAHGGKTVWEWINATETGYAGRVTDVQRVARKDLPWVGSTCDTREDIVAAVRG